ncbi:hypothetical protein GYMLUDRAFT_51331, partial [Collybiopsis luxurians FD-317 M1]
HDSILRFKKFAFVAKRKTVVNIDSADDRFDNFLLTLYLLLFFFVFFFIIPAADSLNLQLSPGGSGEVTVPSPCGFCMISVFICVTVRMTP